MSLTRSLRPLVSKGTCQRASSSEAGQLLTDPGKTHTDCELHGGWAGGEVRCRGAREGCVTDHWAGGHFNRGGRCLQDDCACVDYGEGEAAHNFTVAVPLNRLLGAGLARNGVGLRADGGDVETPVCHSRSQYGR